jgi:cytochrome c
MQCLPLPEIRLLFLMIRMVKITNFAIFVMIFIKKLVRECIFSAASVMFAFILPMNAHAQLADKPTAQAMVAKGVAAIQAEGWKALVEMTAPRKTYVDRDLYLAVYDLNGKCMAHGQNSKQVAKNLLAIKDPDGKEYIRERVTLAKDQRAFWQEYKFTNPVTKAIQSKLAYCERVDDLVVCGGIYK